jgi:L-ribulokinase
MTSVQGKVFAPQAKSVEVYEQLYRIYRRLHDAFGVPHHTEDLTDVMKSLLDLRDKARGNA